MRVARATEYPSERGVRTYVRDLGGPSRRTTPTRLAAGNLTAAEQAAFEIAFVPLAQARALVELYAEKGDLKYERAPAAASAATTASTSPATKRFMPLPPFARNPWSCRADSTTRVEAASNGRLTTVSATDRAAQVADTQPRLITRGGV